jgi:SpoVK/Ycf46/Vps4 family AAA+-type ATPase
MPETLKHELPFSKDRNTSPKRHKVESSTKAPPSEESEPNNKGFRVRIENPKGIFEAAKARKSGQLGQLPLEHPIEDVTVSLVSTAKGVIISGKIETEKYTNIAWDKADSFSKCKSYIYEGITNKYHNVKERGKNFYITTDKGTNFVIVAKDKKEDIEIYTTEASLKTQDEMSTALEDLGGLLTASLDHIYDTVDKQTPDEELVLHPPQKKPKERVLWERTETVTKITPELLGKIKIERPDVSLDDIGGQEEAKEEIDELISAISDPDSFDEWGTRPPKGILFWGPPGTGKTLLAKALASSAEAQFFHVSASDLAKKYVGESEQVLENIFKLAGQSEEKTIIFFDEVDAIIPKRDDAHKSAQGTIATLLEKMDGIKSNKNITFIAATNRLESIDPAFLRADRIDRLIEVGLPDNKAREEIFKIHIRLAQERADAHFQDIGVDSSPLFDTFDFEEIVDQTEKTSGADIKEIIRRSLTEKVRQKRKTGNRPAPVSKKNILEQIKKYERTKKAKEKIHPEAHNMFF